MKQTPAALRQQLSDLFAEWRSRDIHRNNPYFITDGPLEVDRWLKSENKTLFLTKEAYTVGEYDEETWDLSEMVRKWERPCYSFWLTLAAWSYGLATTTIHEIPDYPEDDTSDALLTAFWNSAVVNVKKSGGTTSSTMTDLATYTESDADLILRQLEILNPKLVVCGYTWPLLGKSIAPHAEQVATYAHYDRRKERLFIDYWHPANRYPNVPMYFALCAIYQRAIRAISAP